MNITAKCGCGAQIALAPNSPSELGNGHGYASNNTATVDAEREGVATAFKLWSEQHASCGQRRGLDFPMPTPWFVPQPTVESPTVTAATATADSVLPGGTSK